MLTEEDGDIEILHQNKTNKGDKVGEGSPVQILDPEDSQRGEGNQNSGNRQETGVPYRHADSTITRGVS